MDNELRTDGADMAALARMLKLTLRQPVVDRTGLPGLFEVRMTFDQYEAAVQAGLPVIAPVSRPNLPSLFTALQEQLGLRLEPERFPARVLVIEHVEPPTPD